jgi:hypothetical protein
MIYFVDEDYRQLRALVSELLFRGLQAEIIQDADTAYAKLSAIDGATVDLVFIDVMLAASSDETRSRYSRAATDEFHRTGLLLLDDLAKSNPKVFPKKAIYLTHASNGKLIAAIDESARCHGIKMLKKRDFRTAHDFGIVVESILAEKGRTK